MEWVLGMEHQSLNRLRGGGFVAPTLGTLEDMLKKVSGYGHLSPWGPSPPEGNLVYGGGGLVYLGLR